MTATLSLLATLAALAGPAAVTAPAKPSPPSEAQACRDAESDQTAKARLAHCESALSAAGGSPDRLSLLTAKSNALSDLDQYADAETAASQALGIDGSNLAALLARGRARYWADHNADAFSDFDAAVHASPDSAEALAWRGVLWNEFKKDLAKARADLDMAIQKDARLALAYSGRGWVNRAEKRWTDSLADFQKAFELRPWYLEDGRMVGVSFEDLHRPKEALAQYNAILKGHPESAKTWTYRSSVRYELGEYAGAIVDADTAIAKDAAQHRAYRIKAQALDQQNRLEAAVSALEQDLKQTPPEIETLVAAGGYYRRLSKRDLAHARLESALKLDPKAYTALVELGLLYWDENALDKAIASLTQAIAVNDADADALLQRARVLGEKGEHEAALKDLARAEILSPKWVEILNAKGQSLYRLHRYDESLTAYDQALKLDPGNSDALEGRAFDLDDKGGADAEAVSAYLAAIKASPKSVNLKVYLGQVKARLHLTAESAALYDQALALQPDNADALRLRGLLRYDAGRYKDALADFDRAIKAQPKQASLHTYRGWALDKLGDGARALTAFTEAVDLDPKDDMPLNERGLHFNAAGKYTEALADFDAALKLNPKGEPQTYNRALALENLERFDAAIRQYNAYIALQPKDADGYGGKGDCYRKLDDHVSALENYDRAIALNAKNAGTWWNRAISRRALGDAAGAAADEKMARSLDPQIGR